MFQLLRSVSRLDLFGRQAPCLAVSFVLASALYKFGSFALECVAFLLTWFVLDILYEAARLPRRHRSQLAQSEAGR